MNNVTMMNYNKGKKLLSERFYLTWAGEQMSWTVRMTMKMRDVVDGDLLRQAVESTRLRYPYYQVKLGMRKDAEGTEYFVYEDNSEPWVVSEGEKPVRLIGPESNNHLLAFCCWGDCIAIDFFHCLTDGTGAYNILRTLLYEYSRRRYDATLERGMANIRVSGDTISSEEWEDPAALAKPDQLNPLPLPERLRCINLTTQAKVAVSEDVETVNILVEEQEMMRYVTSGDTSPATLISLLLVRAIARLHPDLTEGVPMVALAINQRPALGCPQAGQSMAASLRLKRSRPYSEAWWPCSRTKTTSLRISGKLSIRKTCSKRFPPLRGAIRQWPKPTVSQHQQPQPVSVTSARLIWVLPNNTSARCTQRNAAVCR